MQNLTRRTALRGSLVALVGVVGGYLAANNSRAARASTGSSRANAYGAPAAAADRPLVRVDQVPVGGGVVLADKRIVVTQPAAGEVHAFTAVCTHQGCTVDTVADGIIQCPCHGSRFDASTGAVVRGPAAKPLAPVTVAVRDGEVFPS